MPPKKRRLNPTVWLPLTWKPLVVPATGEFREYYLPLSNEEIEHDLQHLSALQQQAGGGKRGQRLSPVLQSAGGDASSEAYSHQEEDENESGNPSEQEQWVGHKAMQQTAAAGATVGAATGAAGVQHQQPQVALA